MKSIEYKCAECGGIFDRAWTDEEALAEFHNNFKGHDLQSAVIVCDDCYKKICGVEVEL